MPELSCQTARVKRTRRASWRSPQVGMSKLMVTPHHGAFGRGGRLATVHLASGDERALDGDVLDARLGAGQRIVVEHQEIGCLADLERAAIVFLPCERVARHGAQAQRLFAREVA